MAIKITVSNQVQFKVRGTLNDDAGVARAFDFDIICRRLGTDELQQELADDKRKLTEVVARVVTGWRRVLDDTDAEVPFSDGALHQLMQIPGLPALVYRQYLQEAGVKEKN